MEPERSPWHAIALVATLAVVAVAAVVAVSRTVRTDAQPASSPSPSLSASPTAGGKLAGKGPYVLYAVESGEVFAYDVDGRKSVPLGRLDAAPVLASPQQPGTGSAVAFATTAAEVWRADREGLERVALLPISQGRLLTGGALALDGRRFATATTGSDPELLIVNLRNGRTSALGRERGTNRYPREPLVPVGWSLGGTLVYQVPIGDDTSGLYVYDLTAERSSIVPTTERSRFSTNFGLSPDGQELAFATWEQGPCGDDSCAEPPFTLRRLAAGRTTSSVIRRSSDTMYRLVVWSAEDDAMLLVTADPGTTTVAFELVDPESGDRMGSALRGIPPDARPLALLPGRRVLAAVGPETGSLQMIVRGRVTTIAPAEQKPTFLGWLR